LKRISALTLFQVQISFAVFPDSKLDSGKKQGFSYFDRCLITERKVQVLDPARSQSQKKRKKKKKYEYDYVIDDR